MTDRDSMNEAVDEIHNFIQGVLAEKVGPNARFLLFLNADIEDKKSERAVASDCSPEDAVNLALSSVNQIIARRKQIEEANNAR